MHKLWTKMPPKNIFIISSIAIFFLFSSGVGCAPQEAPKPKIKKVKNQKNIFILDKAIQEKRLEEADSLYLSYRGEHPESKQLPGYMLKLSKAHMEIGEYLLARYYAESYISDYPSGKRIDEAWFLRIKSLFLRFKEIDHSQTLADQLREESKAFLAYFTHSSYRTEIKKMLEVSQQIIQEKNEEIAAAYERMGKKKAADYYRNKNKESSKK